MEFSNYTKPKQLFLLLQSIKKQLWQLFKFCKYFLLLFWTFDQHVVKNQIGRIIKFNLNKFRKVFTQIPDTYKKNLGHAGTQTNVQNNCIKYLVLVLTSVKLFLHREITRNISCREKFFNSLKIISLVLGPTSHTLSIVCRFPSG